MDLKNEKKINEIFDSIVKDHVNDDLCLKYLKSLSPLEKKAIVISKVMLESSFSVEKCIGINEYKKSI
jgi:aspartate carbamoyltransferase regulatory subunit